MKKKITLILGIGSIVIALFIFNQQIINNINAEVLSYPTSYTNEINDLLKSTPLYFTQNSKTYVLNKIGVAKELAPTDGILSPDKNKIAYTFNNSSYTTDPFLYIYNITNAKTEKINLGLNYIFSVNSWSPDNNNIVVIRHSQYAGGMQVNIVNIKTGSISKHFNTINNDGYWINSDYIFSNPLSNCSKNNICIPTGSAISKYNLNTNEIIEIKNISNKFDTIPVINKQLSKDSNEIIYSIYSPEKQSFILDNTQNSFLTINKLENDISKFVGNKNLIINKLKAILPEKYHRAEIREFQKNPNKSNWYLVTLDFDDFNHRLVLVNLLDSSKYLEITNTAQIANW